MSGGMENAFKKEVEQPTHYTDGREYEPVKVIMDWELPYTLGNVVKYISRYGRKDEPLKELLKAREYLNYEIHKLEGK